MQSPRRSPAPRRFAALVAALVLLAACDRTPTAPHQAPAPATAHFAIADGAHGGLASFYFLPPIVSAPSYSGTFDGTKAPTVRVCELAGGACGATVATFSGADVKVDPTDESYMALWKTKDAGLDPTKTYRVEIQLGPQVLGFIDVLVVSNGSQLKHVDGTEFAGLVDGAALPIRFRLEAGTTPTTPPPGPWAGDQYLTYTQAEYGDPQGSGGTFLLARYDAVYSAPSALLTVGSPYPTLPALVFTSASAVLDFLPQTAAFERGVAARLTDPTTTPAGVLGGEAVALYLNIQFSDAGQTPSPNGVRFGDLRLCGFAAPSKWNGVTIREFQGSVTDAAIYGRAQYLEIPEVVAMAAALNAAFANGTPSQFAQEHLVTGRCTGAWQQGDVISYSQWLWGTLGSPAQPVLGLYFDAIYFGGGTFIGLPAPYHMAYFTTSDAVVAYMPDCLDPPASLPNDYLDPSSTGAGCLGSATLALRLDVDFADAGHLNGTSGLRFGDLRVCGVNSPAAIDGEPVRDLLARANQLVGGAVADDSGQYADQLFTLIEDLTKGFEDGMPSFWARMHLVNGACP